MLKTLSITGVALCLLLAACTSDDDGAVDTTVATTAAPTTVAETTTTTAAGYCRFPGGSLVWAHDEEPPDLHYDDPANGLLVTSWIRAGMLEGLYGIGADLEPHPELLAGEADVEEREDGSVEIRYRLRDDLTWDDGEPLTADDVLFTYEVIMAGYDPDVPGSGVYLMGDRLLYEDIVELTVESPAEFTVVLPGFHAGWKSLFAEVYPGHVFNSDPARAADQLNDALLNWTLSDGRRVPASGPLQLDSWEVGSSMRLVRNESYHGSTSDDVANQGSVACVDAVEIQFVGTDDLVPMLSAGEADLVMAQPQLGFADLTGAGFVPAANEALVYEHWGLNLYNEHLADPLVREAVALAMDKTLVLEEIYEPIFGDLLPAEGLGNAYWMTSQPAYEDHAGDAGYGRGDAAAAAGKLEEAGYVLAESGVFEHPDRGALVLRVGTTGGSGVREAEQEILAESLTAAGIQIEIANVEGSDYFATAPFAEAAILCSVSGGVEGDCGIWDVAQFAWSGGWFPGSQSPTFTSRSPINPYGFASEGFDALAPECDQTFDDAARNDCYNALDRYVTTLGPDGDGLFVLPITVVPYYYAYLDEAVAEIGVAPDAGLGGPLVNIVDVVLQP